MLDGLKQSCDWMPIGGRAQIVCRHVQVNLSTRDLPMTEQITNSHDADTGTDEVGGKGVAQSMWRERLAQMRSLPPGSHALINARARELPVVSRTEEWRGGECGAARLHVFAQHRDDLLVHGD